MNVTIDELKTRLKPAGILLAAYFVAPVILQWLLGRHDAVFGSFAVSDALQAGLGCAALYKIHDHKDLLAAALTARLSTRGQPRDKVLELAELIITACGYIGAAGLLLAPLGAMFPASRLITLAKLAALAYTVYAAVTAWNLSHPFLAYVPPPDPADTHEPPPEPSAGRCPKCGQQLTVSMKVCSFCKTPVGDS